MSSPAPESERGPFQLTLLDAFTLLRDGRPVDRFTARQEERLLAYLALEPGVARSRDGIVDTFWPEVETSKARKLLSLYLFKLKERLARSGLAGAIEDSRESLRLAPTIRTDAQAFAEHVLAGTLATAADDKAQHLQAAVELYGVGLLPSYGYDWVADHRQRYEILYREAVSRLAELLDPSGRLHDVFAALPPGVWKSLARRGERETGADREPPVPPDVQPAAPAAQSSSSRSSPPATPTARSRRSSTSSPSTPSTSSSPSTADVKRIEALVREAEGEMNGPHRQAAIDRLTERIDEIRAALKVRPTVASFPGLLAMAAALWRYWYLTSQVPEGRSYVEELLASGLDAPHHVRAAALHAAGTLANLEGDRDIGIQRLRDAAEAWHVLGDDGALLHTIVNLALARHDEGQYEEARPLHAQAVRLARRLGQESSLARALFNSSRTEHKLGDGRAARALLEERLALPIAGKDPQLRGITYAHMASAAAQYGDMETARAEARAALDLFAHAPDPRGHALAQCVMGWIHLTDGQLEASRAALLVALDQARAAADMTLTGMALAYLASVHERLGETDKAAQFKLNATVLLKSARANANLDDIHAEVGEMMHAAPSGIAS